MTDPSPGRSRRPRPLVVDVHVPAESHSYPVLIGRGTLARLGVELQQRLGHRGTVALVSDITVAGMPPPASERSPRRAEPLHVNQQEGLNSATVRDKLHARGTNGVDSSQDIVINATLCLVCSGGHPYGDGGAGGTRWVLGGRR